MKPIFSLSLLLLASLPSASAFVVVGAGQRQRGFVVKSTKDDVNTDAEKMAQQTKDILESNDPAALLNNSKAKKVEEKKEEKEEEVVKEGIFNPASFWTTKSFPRTDVQP